MALIFAVFLFIFAVFPVQITDGNMTPFCHARQENNSSPKLPSFPEAFEATVEVTIVEQNYTFFVKEFYDKNANKGALRTIRNGKSIYMIYNYNEDEVLVIDEENRNCSMQDIDSMQGFPFFGRNSSKIEGMADLFRFGAAYNETFIGNETVRGIPCFHWQSCINHGNYSFYLDYYFSIPDWSMPYGKMQVLRAIVNGTTTRQRHSRHSLPGNTTRSFYNVYDFFSFKPGPPEASAFEVPRGVFCAGMKDRNPLPEMKSVFSMELELLFLKSKKVSFMKEYYDIDRSLVMIKYYDYRHRGYGETRIIQDFTHGVQYNVSGSVCQNVTLLSLNNTWGEAVETADHHLRLKTSLETIFSNNKSALVYTGSSNVRGIDADVWIIKKDYNFITRQKTEISMEYYFSKKTWTNGAGSLRNQSQVLLRMQMYELTGNMSTIINVFNFDAEAVPLSMFNIHPCFAGNRAVVSVKLKGDWMKEVLKYETQFNIGVRNSVADAAGVSKMRVDNVWNGKSSEFIQIWFTLLGKPPLVAPYFKKAQINLTEALDTLRKKVEQGNLVIKWTNPEKGQMSKKAEKFFYDATFPENPSTSPTVNPTDDHRAKKMGKKGVPGGAVAGIAFLMIAIGICVGLAIAHFIMKRRGTSLFKYQRQE